MKKFSALVITLIFSTVLVAQVNVTSAEIKNYAGQIVSICDRIVDAKFLESSITKPTLLNVGGAYPNHLFTIVINFENRGNFSFKPEEYYLNKRVCVTGKVVDFKGRPQIVVLSPAEMIINENETPAVSHSTSGVVNKAVPPVNAVVTSSAATQKDTLVKPAPLSSLSSASATVQKNTSTAPARVNAVAPAQSITNKAIGDTTSTAKAGTQKAFETYDIKLTADVNVRSGPANTTEVLEVLKAGTVVSIHSSENGWSYVSYQRYSAEQMRPIVMKGYIKNSVLK